MTYRIVYILQDKTLTMSTKLTHLIRVSRQTYENLVFLRASIEAQLGKPLSFNKLLRHLSGYLMKKIENDDFENELLRFIQEGEEKNDR